MFGEKDAPTTFVKLIGKQLCRSLFHNKASAQAHQACNHVKIETPTKAFFYEVCEVFNDTFFVEHLGATASEIISAYLKVFCKWPKSKNLVNFCE